MAAKSTSQGQCDPGYLDQARVLRVDGHDLRVELQDGREVDAALAMLIPYRPRVHDDLLVIGRDGAFFAIGVLRGRGGFETQYKGDFHLTSMAGDLCVVAARRLLVDTPAFELQAHKMLSRAAERIVMTSERTDQSARDHWVLMSAAFAEVTQKRWFRRAQRVVIKVANAIRFNGKTVRTG